ncbi:MAG: S9 family peptidase, partial [Planctomycetota bacterium]
MRQYLFLSVYWLWLFSFGALVVSAQTQKKLSLSTLSEIQDLSDPQISPEESKVAFVVTGYNEDEEHYFSNLWWLLLKNGTLRQVTYGKTLHHSHPRFSPEGDYLAFLSDREKEKTLVWFLPLDGGEASRAFDFPYDIESFSWSSDGKSLLFLSKVPTQYQYPKKEEDSEKNPKIGEEAIEEATTVSEVLTLMIQEDGSVLLAGEALSLEDLDKTLKEEADLHRDSETQRSYSEIHLGMAPNCSQVAILKVIERCANFGLWKLNPIPFALESATEEEEVSETEEKKLEIILEKKTDEKTADASDESTSAEEADKEAAKPHIVTRLYFKSDGDGYLNEERMQAFLWNRDTQEITQLTSGAYDVDRAVFSPTGAEVLLESNRTEDPDSNYNTDLWVLHLKTNTLTQLTQEESFDYYASWSPDGQWIAYLRQEPGIYTTPHCARISAKGGTPEILTQQLDRYLDEPPQWAPDSQSLFLTVPDRAEIRLIRLFFDGTIQRLVDGGGDIGSFTIAPQNKALFSLFFHYDRPAELTRISLEDGTKTQQTFFNTKLFDSLALTTSKKILYPSQDGTMIEAWVIFPPEFKPDQQYPLLLDIHGGPVWQYSGAFDFETSYLASRGYVILHPNPRGSYGYGEAFCSAIKSNWGEKDYDDVVGGVDYLMQQGYIRADQLGVGGWSYGGILTNYVITKTTRFKAAVSGASLIEYNSCYGTDDCMKDWELEFGFPWETRELYTKISPIHQLHQVKTPTLVMCGEKDYRCPLSQSEQLYTRLKRLKVETALIIYPGESHSISEMGLYKDKVHRI